MEKERHKTQGKKSKETIKKKIKEKENLFLIDMLVSTTVLVFKTGSYSHIVARRCKIRSGSCWHHVGEDQNGAGNELRFPGSLSSPRSAHSECHFALVVFFIYFSMILHGTEDALKESFCIHFRFSCRARSLPCSTGRSQTVEVFPSPRRLRPMMGIKWPGCISNEEFLEKARQTNMESILLQMQLGLSGHVATMEKFAFEKAGLL